MIDYKKNFYDNSILSFFIKAQNDPSRGQVQFCYNLIAKFFEKRISPCKQEFPEVQVKRQILDHYLRYICYITSHYGIFTIKTASPKPNHKKTPNTNKRYRYRILKSCYSLYKKYTTPNFPKSKFNIHKRCIFNFLLVSIHTSIKKTQGDSPTQTSRHTAVRREKSSFSKF